MQVTELIAGSERIIGIRAYDSEEDLTGVIRLQNIMGTQAVYDCETGKQLGTISSSKSEFSTTAPKGHCRLLYVGTEKQWQARNQ